MENSKSKVAAGILGILLGSLGIHNFYLGFTKKGVIQLVVTLVCAILSPCTLGITAIGSFGIAIWGLIEGIMILVGKIDKDANGVALS